VVVHPIQSCGVCPACLAGEDVFCRHMKVWGFQTGPYIGAYAQYARVRAAQCFAKPAHLSWTEAAVASGVAATAWRMLVTRAQVKPGETVLIFGASGGTGAAGIQLAKAMGATVIAVTSSKPKAEFCLKQGADHVIRSDVSDVAKEARLITNRRGVDVVFDHVGETTWPIGINALRWGGRLVICGATEGFDAKVDLRHLWNKQLSLLGSHAANHRDCGEVLRMIEQRQLRPAMTEVIGLQDIPDAHRRMEARQIMGKIAVDVVGR
jgi:alcohol dehydrogenase